MTRKVYGDYSINKIYHTPLIRVKKAIIVSSESLYPILSILECVLNLLQAFYEEKFCSFGMKFSKSTFGPSFLSDKF